MSLLTYTPLLTAASLSHNFWWSRASPLAEGQHTLEALLDTNWAIGTTVECFLLYHQDVASSQTHGRSLFSKAPTMRPVCSARKTKKSGKKSTSMRSLQVVLQLFVSWQTETRSDHHELILPSFKNSKYFKDKAEYAAGSLHEKWWLRSFMEVNPTQVCLLLKIPCWLGTHWNGPFNSLLALED